MSIAARRAIAYAGLGLTALYFFVVAWYYMTGLDAVFILWEGMIALSALYMLLFFIAILESVGAQRQGWKIVSLVCAVCTLAITSTAHYANMTADGAFIADFLAEDALAWGVFTGLAFLFASLSLPAQSKGIGRVKYTCLVCGCLCFAGFIGHILGVTPLWFVAVAGYGPGTAVVCGELLVCYKREVVAGQK